MAITVNTGNAASTTNNSAPDSLSFSHTLASGDEGVIIGVMHYGSFSGGGGLANPGPPTVTYGGVSVPNEKNIQDTTFFGLYAAIYFLKKSSLPSTGSKTVSIDHDDSASSAGAFAVAVSGVADAAAEAVGSGNTGGGTSSTDNITTVTNNALVFDCLGTAFSGTSAMTASGQTIVFDTPQDGNNVNIFGSYKIVSTAGASSMTANWATSCTYSAHVSIALAEAAAADDSYAVFLGTNF